MRFTPCALLLLPAVVAAANLYIYDPQTSDASHDSTTNTISGDTARLVIASRLGLDRYHSLSTHDQSALDQVNELSGSQSFFAPQDASVALVLAEGISQDDLPEVLGSSHVKSVQVSHVPSLSASEKLLLDLAVQSGLHSDAAELRHVLVASPAGQVFTIVQDSEALTSTLKTLINQHYTILTLAVPKDTTSKHTYGSYDMPSSTHQKRQFKEAPLITDSTNTSPKLKATLTPNLAPKNNTPLAGILPSCFPSLSACQSMTRNCTGHGACTLLHTDKDASDLSGKCFACSCKPEVRTNKDGTKKTTKWGGPACQKKDVVMPFWLLAGFTVAFVSIVSWGIGLLYTMGSQELPSVIGAGVSGVSKPK